MQDPIIQECFSEFRDVYTVGFAREYALLVRNLEHWELSPADYKAMDEFAAQSERNTICIGLYLVKHAPRESFSRQKGLSILEKAIEDAFLRDDPQAEFLVQGILGFIRTRPAAFVRLYDYAKSWQVVRSAFTKKAA